MKAIIVCVVAILALGALVHGENDVKFGKLSKRELELTDLMRPRRICEPGSTKAVECNHCFCMPDGSGWGCTQMGCATYQLKVSDLADPAPEA